MFAANWCGKANMGLLPFIFLRYLAACKKTLCPVLHIVYEHILLCWFVHLQAGNMPIHIASYNGQHAVVACLLAAGAILDKPNVRSNSCHKWTCCPFYDMIALGTSRTFMLHLHGG